MLTAPGPYREVATPPAQASNVERSRLARLLAGLSGPTLLVIVAAVYLALAQLIIWLNDPVKLGAGFWPAAGVSLALLLLLDERRWPWVLGGVAIAELGGDLAHGYPLGAIVLWTVGNVIEPLVGALLIRRFSSRYGALTPLSALVGFIALGVVVGPLVGATIGSLGTIIFVGSSAIVTWPKYVVGDALGVLVVAPVLLTWFDAPISRSRLEAISLAVSATVVTFLVFQNWEPVWDVTLPYLTVPFFMWAGVRFGIRGMALIAFMVANIANWSTAMGYGPFAIAGGTDHAVTLLQLFLGITLTAGFVLASLTSDLTDSREVARRQAEHASEMQRTREFRDAFVGVLSHEIRTPITTIYGMSQLLIKRRHSLDSDEVAGLLDDIERESDRLRRLTEDLLVLSRAEGGRLQLASDPIVLSHLIRKTVESEGVRATGRLFTVEAGPGLPLVLGEEVYVEQVVRNFVSNAVKYTQPGTPVSVRATSEERGVAVRVIDAGPGLPEGPPDRLFELFYRAPNAIGHTPGAGIGLFVCRQLIESMGGRVWAAPASSGTGAEFGFWLPGAVGDAIDA